MVKLLNLLSTSVVEIALEGSGYKPYTSVNGQKMILNAKTEIRNQLKAIYRLLNTVAQKEGFTPNTDTYTDQQLIERRIK